MNACIRKRRSSEGTIFAHEVLNSYGREKHGQPASYFFRKREEHSGRRQRIMGEKICEIRLRVDRPVIVETSREDYFLNNGGEWQEHPYGAHLVTEAGDTGVDRLAVSGFGCLCR